MTSSSLIPCGKSAQTYILDFSDCLKEDDINLILKKNFSLPDGICRDWVKIWEFLEKKFLKKRSVTVELHGFFGLSCELRKSCRFLIEILEAMQCEYKNFSYAFIF